MKDLLREQAKDLYVNSGFGIDTILNVLENSPSRKTLYNWKNEDNWDELRRNQFKRNEDIKEDLYELTLQAINEARTNPSPRNLFAVAKMVGVLKTLQTIKLDDDEESAEEKNKPKAISPDTIKMIERDILGIDR